MLCGSYARSLARVVRGVLLVWLAIAASGVQAEDWVYTVRPGDNLWDICARYVKTPDCWRKVAERNRVAEPRQIPPGTRLHLPLEWLKARTAKAAVLHFEGNAQVLWRGVQVEAIRAGQLLSVGDVVVVQDGQVVLRFGDGSELLVKANSRLQLDTLTVYGDIGMADTRVRLERGRARATVQPSKSGMSTFEVITPAAVAAARGTDFRVTSEGEDTALMRTEVLHGEVVVRDQEYTVPLLAGQAVGATEGDGVGEPITLLQAPQLRQSVPESVSIFPWTLAWNELPDAERYQLEMYRLNGQRTRFGEYQLEEAQVSFDYLEAGTYELFLRGVDKYRFEGFDREIRLKVTKPVVLDVPELRARRQARKAPDTIHWQWQVEQQAPAYELAITSHCEGETHTRYERVEGTEFISQHPGCDQVSAQVAPWVQGQSYERSNEVDVSLTRKTGFWSVIIAAAVLTLLAL